MQRGAFGAVCEGVRALQALMGDAGSVSAIWLKLLLTTFKGYAGNACASARTTPACKVLSLLLLHVLVLCDA